MIPHPFFSLMVVWGLLWIFCMLPLAWPSPCPATPQRPAEPIVPRRPRSSEPQSFAGLTHKPHCVACEPAPPAPRSLPLLRHRHGSPPPLAASARWTPGTNSARTQTVPLGAGWAGGISAPMVIPIAVPGGSCCVSSVVAIFSRPSATLFHSKRTSVELIVRVLACLAEGLGIRGTARVFEVDPNTVLGWLVDAAEQLRAFSRHFLHDVRVRQVQLDELFALLSAVKEGEVSEAEAIERLERSPQWVWVAMDPESKLLLAIDVGSRTLAMAQRVVHHVAQVLAPDCAPLFLTDGFRE
jgi:hypothetical protein